MREKDRKKLELDNFKELTKVTAEILQPPKKDIDTLVRYHRSLRQANVEELFEAIFGEYNNLPLKLERYGQSSEFWKKTNFTYSAKDSNAKSKGPSTAWLRSKVKCYEHEAIN